MARPWASDRSAASNARSSVDGRKVASGRGNSPSACPRRGLVDDLADRRRFDLTSMFTPRVGHETIGLRRLARTRSSRWNHQDQKRSFFSRRLFGLPHAQYRDSRAADVLARELTPPLSRTVTASRAGGQTLAGTARQDELNCSKGSQIPCLTEMVSMEIRKSTIGPRCGPLQALARAGSVLATANPGWPSCGQAEPLGEHLTLREGGASCTRTSPGET